jgi:hypothetical protein
LPDANKKDIENENPHEMYKPKRPKQTIILPSGEKVQLNSDDPAEMEK